MKAVMESMGMDGNDSQGKEVKQTIWGIQPTSAVYGSSLLNSLDNPSSPTLIFMNFITPHDLALSLMIKEQ